MCSAKSTGEIDAAHAEAEAQTLAILGKRIRDLRKARQMTLQQLAEASGLSSSMLSLVERGRAAPSIGSLLVLADVLGETMSDLLATDGQVGTLVVRAANVRPVETADQITHRMMKEDRANGVSISVIDHAPQAGATLPAVRHEGFEYGLLLEGQLTVEVDGQDFVLLPGDLVAYASRRLHRIWNHGDTAARSVWINADRR